MTIHTLIIDNMYGTIHVVYDKLTSRSMFGSHNIDIVHADHVLSRRGDDGSLLREHNYTLHRTYTIRHSAVL